MSNLEDRGPVDADALDARYKAARAKLETSRKIEVGQAGATVFAALAYGEALESNSAFKTVSHWAKLMCIAALFLIPNLLVIRVLL